MIPLRDVIPSRTTPYVTVALIVLNVLVFLVMPPGGSGAFHDVVHAWGVRPAAFALTDVGSALFVHAGVAHLVSNVLFLWIFGDNVEDRLGHGRYLLFYGLCALGAALVQLVFEAGSTVAMVGASGAVAGVLGAYLVLFPESRVLTFALITFVEVPAGLLIGIWFVGQWLSGVGALAILQPADMGSVAFPSLVGGFAAGATLVLLLRRPERMRADWWDVLT